MAGLLGLGPLFGVVRSLVPAQGEMRNTINQINKTADSYENLAATATGFYQSVIASNLELQQQIRQSTIILTSQLNVFDAAGNKVDNFADRFEALGPRVKAIQREIELSTRDIVGATDSLTNAIFNQTITQFGTLQGQAKGFADELSAIPELVTGLTTAFTTFQIPEFQVPQEIRSLLQGDLNNPDSELAKQLKAFGLTKEALEEARAAGEGIKLITETVKDLVAANASGADSIQNSFSIIQSVTELLFRTLGEDPTEGLRKGLTNVVSIINSIEFEKKIVSIAKAFGGPVGRAISDTFEKMTEDLSELGGVLDNFDLEEMASIWGKLLGDVISITGDLVVAVVGAIGVIGTALTGLLKAIEVVIDSINDFRKAVTISDMVLEVEAMFNTSKAEKDISDFEKSLDSKGALRKFVDLIIRMTPAVFIQNRTNQATEDSIQFVIDGLKQEFSRNAETIDVLVDMATKIRDIDTSSITDFTVDLTNDLKSEIGRLEDAIDFSGLDEKTSQEVENVLKNITSTTGFARAQEQIDKIIRSASIGGIEVLEEYKTQLAIVELAISDAIAERDSLVAQANKNNLTSLERERLVELNDLIEEQVKLRGNISIALDPEIAKKQANIEKLEAEGKETAKLREELEKLKEERREIGDPTSFGGKSAGELGNSLIKVYNDLNTAVEGFAQKVAKNNIQVGEDFERMSAALQKALQFGAVSVEDASNLLIAAITDTTLPVEQRMMAQKQLVELVKAETQLANTSLEVERSKNNLLAQRGIISNEELALLNNQTDLAKNYNDLQVIQKELEANQLLTKENSVEVITEELDVLRKQLETADEQETIRLEGLITQKQELLNQVALEGQEEKRLTTEIERLEVERQSLQITQNELKLNQALVEVAQKRRQADQEINSIIVRRNLELAKARQEGVLKVDIAVQRQDGVIDDTRARLLANEEEILNRVNALEDLRKELLKEGVGLELTKAKELELQNELVNLQNEGLTLQTQLISETLAKEEMVMKNAIDRQNQIIRLKDQTIDAEYGLAEAGLKVEQTIIDSVNASKELENSIKAVKENALGIEIANLQLRLTGIDKIDALKEKLEGIEPNTEQFKVVQKAIKKTDEMYELSAKKSTKLMDMFRGLKISTITEDDLARIQEVIDAEAELRESKRTDLKGQLMLIDEITEKELQQAETKRQNQIEAIDQETTAKKLSIQISDLEIEKERDKLEIKRLQLEAEKAMLALKVKSGEISAEDAAGLTSNLNKQLTAYDKIETSLDNQQTTNQEIANNIDEIANNSKQIVNENSTLEKKKIVIAGEEDKIKRSTSDAADEGERFADEADRGATNTGNAANQADRLATNMKNASISSSSAYGQAGSDSGVVDTSTGGSSTHKGVTTRTPGEISTYDPKTGIKQYYDTGGNKTRFARFRPGQKGAPDYVEPPKKSKYRKMNEDVPQVGRFVDSLVDFDSSSYDKRIASYSNEQKELLGYRNGFKRGGSGPLGSIGKREIDALNSEQYKYLEKQKLKVKYQREQAYQKALQEYRDEIRGVKKNQPKKSTQGRVSVGVSTTTTSETSPLTDSEIITQALAKIGNLSRLRQTPEVVSEIKTLNKTITDILSSQANNPQILAAQQRLTDLLRTPNRTTGQDMEIAELLGFIKEATEATAEATEADEKTATTLLEAINSGAFQAGAFTPETDTVVLQNPDTGEIVIGGTRLEDSQLDMLFEVKTTNSLLSDIKDNTAKTPPPVVDDAEFVLKEVLSPGFEQPQADPLLSGNDLKIFENAVKNSFSETIKSSRGETTKIFGENVAVPGQYIHGITPAPKDQQTFGMDFQGDDVMVKNPYTGEFQTATQVAFAIKAGGGTGINETPVAFNTPGTEITPIQAERALKYLDRRQGQGPTITPASRVNDFGLITPEQKQLDSGIRRIEARLTTDRDKISVIERNLDVLEGRIDAGQVNLLRFRNELSLARTENDKLNVYQRYGFESKEAGNLAISQLAPLKDFVHIFVSEGRKLLPNYEEAMNTIRTELKDIINSGTSGVVENIVVPDFIMDSSSIGSVLGSVNSVNNLSGLTSSISSSTSNTNPNPTSSGSVSHSINSSSNVVSSPPVVNNYFPDQTGNLSAILREAGL